MDKEERIEKSLFSNDLYFLMCVSMYGVRPKLAKMYRWRSKGNLPESVLYFHYYVGAQNRPKIIRLGTKHFCLKVILLVQESRYFQYNHLHLTTRKWEEGLKTRERKGLGTTKEDIVRLCKSKVKRDHRAKGKPV